MKNSRTSLENNLKNMSQVTVKNIDQSMLLVLLEKGSQYQKQTF